MAQWSGKTVGVKATPLIFTKSYWALKSGEEIWGTLLKGLDL
jgi:hypothetical protein